MKATILLHLLCFTGSAAAWSLDLEYAGRRLRTMYREVFGSVLPRPNIPQFILDLDHPWITENGTQLGRYVNASSALCFTNSTLPAKIKPPPDLFHSLRIQNLGYRTDRLGWTNANDRLREMLACPSALQNVKDLQIEVYVHDSEYSDYVEPTLPPITLPALFADALAQMPNLESIEWGMPAEAAAAFERDFVLRNLSFPKVKSLNPSRHYDFLVRMCPTLEELRIGRDHHRSWTTDWAQKQIDPELMLIQSAATVASSLKTLEMRPSRYTQWTVQLLEGTCSSTTV